MSKNPAHRRWNSYFRVKREYPDPVTIPLVPGTLYEYVSSTFLNGWVNYTGIFKKAYLINRYRSREENEPLVDAWHQKPPFHADLRSLKDDILLLTKHEFGGWWYYWFDRDCSDCCVGRPDVGGDTDEQVLLAFDEHVLHVADWNRHGPEDGEPLPIDPSTIRGWVSG